jgi:predicted transcriptional regulator
MNAPILSSKTLLLSIRPVYAELILAGKKTIELRKQRPRVPPGTLVVMYASAPTCAIVGAFVLHEIVELQPSELWKLHSNRTGISRELFERYYEHRDQAFGLVVGRVLPLLATVGLAQLRQMWGKFQPPQSYRFIHRRQSTQSVSLAFADSSASFALRSP